MAETAVEPNSENKGTRRDFLYLVTGATAAVGTAALAWPFVDSMAPSASVLALATIEVDLSPIGVGQAITVTWRGKPVFIRHRTEAEIEMARQDDAASLPDPETDADRVIEPQWLVMMGQCTHLGCVPSGQKASDNKGDYNGWFCPCHGSHYDTSGRIRKGPAPANLPVPEYAFLEENVIQIG